MERAVWLVKGFAIGALLAAIGIVFIIGGFLLLSADLQCDPNVARMMRAAGLPMFSVGLVTFVSFFVWLHRGEHTDDKP